jgi:hypothetical protein
MNGMWIVASPASTAPQHEQKFQCSSAGSKARRQASQIGPSEVATMSQNKTKRTDASVRIPKMKFSKVYPLYVQKAERKNRTREEVDQVIRWLTGYTEEGLQQQIQNECDFERFFAEAPAIHPNSSLIRGVICGVRVEEIEDPLVQKVRYLDKLIDELAKGKALEKVMREERESQAMRF